VFALGWSLANFAVLAVILRTVTDPKGVRTGRLIGWVALKIVGLYGLAVWVLLHRWFPLLAFLAGFSWPLVVVVLRALGPLVVRGRTASTGDPLRSGAKRSTSTSKEMRQR
jgi:hypothetical protein